MNTSNGENTAEKDMERIFNFSESLICKADLKKAQFFKINPAFKRILGYSENELLGKSFINFIHPDDKKKTLDIIEKNLLKGKKVLKFKNRYRCKDGSYKVLIWESHPVKEEGFTYAIARDITKQEKIEQELTKSRDYIHNIVDSIPDPLFVKDKKHKWILLNNAFCKFMGREREELIGKTDYDFFPKYQADVFWEKEELAFKQKTKNVNEEDFTDANGILHTIITKRNFIEDVYGEEILIGSIRDVSEAKRSEEIILFNARIQSLLSDISAAYLSFENFEETTINTVKLLGEFLDVSRVYIFENYNNGEITKNTFEWCNDNIIPQIKNLQNVEFKDIPSWKNILLSKGMIVSNDITKLPKDLQGILKKQNIKSILVFPLYVKSHFFGFVGFDYCRHHHEWSESEIKTLETISTIISNAHESKLDKDRIKESEKKLKNIVENSNEIFYIHDKDHYLQYVSPQCKEILGYTPDELKIKWTSLITKNPINEEGIRITEKIMRTGEGHKPYLLELKTKKGIKIIVEINESPLRRDGKIVGLVGALRDVTEKKRAEENLKNKVEELEKFNKLAVDRELKMVKLKKRIKELES